MIAWIALAISLASLAILVWDKFLRRAEWDVQADWILSASEPALRFVVLNVGYRKGTVRDIRLRSHDMPKGRGWTPYERVMSKLPLVLDADEGSEAFVLQPRPRPSDVFDDALAAGRIDTIEIEDARGDISVFALPDLHRAQHEAATSGGKTIPKTTP